MFLLRVAEFAAALITTAAQSGVAVFCIVDVRVKV